MSCTDQTLFSAPYSNVKPHWNTYAFGGMLQGKTADFHLKFHEIMIPTFLFLLYSSRAEM